MQVGNENGVNRVRSDSMRPQRGIHRLATIQKQRGFAKAIKKRRVTSVRARPAIAHTQAGHRKFSHTVRADSACEFRGGQAGKKYSVSSFLNGYPIFTRQTQPAKKRLNDERLRG
jgi:hypothetical protein